MKTSESVDKVFPALFEVKKKIPALKKQSDNPFFKSKYLELSDILDVLEPLLHEQGLFLTQGTVYRDGKTLVISRFNHAASGQYVESEYPAETGSSKPQELGSAVSYSRRYGLQALGALNAVDDDGQAASHSSSKPADKPAARSSGFRAGPAKEDPAASPAADKAPEVPAPAKEESAPAARRGSFGSR